MKKKEGEAFLTWTGDFIFIRAIWAINTIIAKC